MIYQISRSAIAKGFAALLGLSMLANSCSMNSFIKREPVVSHKSIEDCMSCHSQLTPVITPRNDSFLDVYLMDKPHFGPYRHNNIRVVDGRTYKQYELEPSYEMNSEKCWTCHTSNNAINLYDSNLKWQIKQYHKKQERQKAKLANK